MSVQIDMCIDMCIDMHIEMCVDMCTDICTDMCIDVRMSMRSDMRVYVYQDIDVHIDMCIDMCMDVRSVQPTTDPVLREWVAALTMTAVVAVAVTALQAGRRVAVGRLFFQPAMGGRRCARAHMHSSARAGLRACRGEYRLKCLHSDSRPRRHALMRASERACVRAYVHACMCVCLRLHACVHVCMRTGGQGGGRAGRRALCFDVRCARAEACCAFMRACMHAQTHPRTHAELSAAQRSLSMDARTHRHAHQRTRGNHMATRGLKQCCI